MNRVPWIARLVGHIPPGQFLRYLMVGAWNTLFGYGTYALLTAILMRRSRFGYLYAAVLSSLLNITVAYLGYKFFVFKTKGRYLTEWSRCILVYGTAILPGLFALPVLVESLHHGLHLMKSAPYVAGAIVSGFTALYGFLGHKHFSFRVAAKANASAGIETGNPAR